MNSKFLLTLVVIIVVVIVGFALYKNQADNKTAVENSTKQTQTATPTNAPQVNVVLTQNGFEPKELKIKAGIRVIWTNKSGEPATVNSDNHPTHLLYPFLNLGEFSTGSSLQAIVASPGTYTYHNHLNATQKGTIVAE